MKVESFIPKGHFDVAAKYYIGPNIYLQRINPGSINKRSKRNFQNLIMPLATLQYRQMEHIINTEVLWLYMFLGNAINVKIQRTWFYS